MKIHLKYKISYLFIMKLNKFISIPIFLISFTLGLFVIYITGPTNKKIYVYPTPENIDSFLWKDKANNCYKWDIKEVNKPKDDKNIKSIPVQD